MSTKRASFTSDIVTILLGILPDHVTPAGGKVDWDNVANILNQRTGKTFSAVSVKNWFSNMKEKHKAWRELKRWTGLGLGPNNCPLVDLESERWLAFSKKYKSNGRSLLRTPFENEQEWNNIFKGGYASGDLSFTPVSLGHKEREDVDEVEDEGPGDSDDVPGDETQTPNISIQPSVARSDPKKRKSIDSHPSRISGKKSREEDIDACLDVLRRSSLSQSSKPKNAFDEVLSILDSMGTIEQYGESFAVDILDSFRKTPGAVDIFTILRSDEGRLHFIRKHCKLPDETYKPDTTFSSLISEDVLMYDS